MYDVQIPINDPEQSQQQSRRYYPAGILTLLPEQEENPKKGIVVFAHGSGSSGRHSPRNRYVALVLNNSGISTLLVDLLTEEEQKIDEKTREYRFNTHICV